jgi:hypothetical protein
MLLLWDEVKEVASYWPFLGRFAPTWSHDGGYDSPFTVLGPILLLGLLANYKSEFRNPYQQRLDDFVNEATILTGRLSILYPVERRLLAFVGVFAPAWERLLRSECFPGWLRGRCPWSSRRRDWYLLFLWCRFKQICREIHARVMYILHMRIKPWLMRRIQIDW